MQLVRQAPDVRRDLACLVGQLVEMLSRGTELARELIEGLLAWKNNLGFTMIVVDHQAQVLERLSPHVAVLEQGQVIQQGDWEQVRASPATDLLRKLLAPL